MEGLSSARYFFHLYRTFDQTVSLGIENSTSSCPWNKRILVGNAHHSTGSGIDLGAGQKSFEENIRSKLSFLI